MFSNSKSATTNANASDGGWLTMGGIAPLTINKGLNTQTVLLILGGVAALGLAFWLILRK